MTAERIFRARRAILPEGERAADVVVRGGRIDAVLPWGEASGGVPVADCGDACLLPGLVDTHVHVNEPGRTEWEGFATATRAAAAGGITTIVDMPLNSVPATTTVAGLEAKRAAAEAAGILIDCGFWGGVVPGNHGELEPLAVAGVLGFKCFLAPSGVDEFPHVSERDLAAAMPILARLGLPLLVHAESPARIAEAEARSRGRDPRSHATWLDSRPPAAELDAIRMMVRLCEKTSCAVHIVHLAAGEALPELRAAKERGLPLTVETCPHYLAFAADEIEDGATAFKCAPPIRDRANRERLWEGLRAGTIDLVATDHSPCPPDLERVESGDFAAAWGGIASLEVALASVWTGGRSHGASPEDLVRWMADAPARLAGVADLKGRIVAGADADFAVWEPDGEWTVDGTRLHHRHPVTPHHGRRLRGRVRATILGGETVFERDRDGAGRFPAPGRGRLLARAVPP